MTLNGVMAVAVRNFTEFGKHAFQHITAASICGGIYARVYCILYCVYDVVVKKVHVRHLISWWVSCLASLTAFSGVFMLCKTLQHASLLILYSMRISSPVLTEPHRLSRGRSGLKALNEYLATDCHLSTTVDRRRLRSSSVVTCDILRTRTSWSIYHSLLLNLICATTYLSLRDTELTFWEFRRLWSLVSLKTAAPSDCWF